MIVVPSMYVTDGKLVYIIEDYGGPAASLQDTVSMVQWVNRLFPAWGGRGLQPDPGDAPTLSMELGCPMSNVLLHW